MKDCLCRLICSLDSSGPVSALRWDRLEVHRTRRGEGWDWPVGPEGIGWGRVVAVGYGDPNGGYG